MTKQPMPHYTLLIMVLNISHGEACSYGIKNGDEKKSHKKAQSSSKRGELCVFLKKSSKCGKPREMITTI